MPNDEIHYDDAGAEELHQLGKDWGDIPESERRGWCQAQLSFPPVWLGTIFMNETVKLLSAGRYSSIRWWVGVAREFHAAGFTADQYSILPLCIMHQQRDEWVRHPLIHASNLNAPRDFLRAAEWTDWLELVHLGHPPLRATQIVMSRL